MAQVITKFGPATADAGVGEIFTYTINYTCPSTVSGDCDNVVISDVLPSGLEYINSTTGSTFDINSGEVSTDLGTVPNGATRSLQINVRFPAETLDGTEVVNNATVNYTQVAPESETSNPVTITAINGVVINFSNNLQNVKTSNGLLLDGTDYNLRYNTNFGNECTYTQTNFVVEDILPNGMVLNGIDFDNYDICVPAIPYELYVQVIDRNTGVTQANIHNITTSTKRL